MNQCIKVNLDKGEMVAYGKTIPVACKVRNELNGLRKPNEVIFSIPDKKPVYPRTFPKGVWNVYKPLPRPNEPYLAPFFIPTDAWEYLPIWQLDGKGQYGMAMKYTTRVEGYGFHYSTSNTTLGCIKILKLDDLLFLVERINDDLANKKRVTVEVV